MGVSATSDRLLIQQIRQGDARAWEHLISSYEGRLLAFVQRRVHDRAASEDVVQETFIGLLNSLPNFDDKRDLQTYLFTIASHKIVDFFRRQGRHPLLSIPDEGSDNPLRQKPDEHPAASSVARGQERRELESQALVRALGELLGEWREEGEFWRIKLLELLFVKGWANKDVAAFLKVSEQQVANARFAAVKKITDQIRSLGLPADVFPELQAGSE
jgi:RNA polymerase sigma-70 factor, ECF subfamily